MDNRNNHRITPVTGYTNPVQNFAEKHSSKIKIKTKVVVAKIDIGFPK
jgi:hypothetical protein